MVQCESIRPSGHSVSKWRHNVGAKSRRIDINTTSFSRHVPAGPGEIEDHQLLSWW